MTNQNENEWCLRLELLLNGRYSNVSKQNAAHSLLHLHVTMFFSDKIIVRMQFTNSIFSFKLKQHLSFHFQRPNYSEVETNQI